MNCAAVPSELVESELFGHEKGAFTGAACPARRAGSSRPTAARSSSTRSATCRADMQAKLLRVLQDGELTRVGGTGEIKVDVRLISATNRDLEALLEGGPLPRGPLLPAQHAGRAHARRCATGPGDVAALAAHFVDGRLPPQPLEAARGRAGRGWTCCASSRGRATSAS